MITEADLRRMERVLLPMTRSQALAEDAVADGVLACLEREIELSDKTVFVWARFAAKKQWDQHTAEGKKLADYMRHMSELKRPALFTKRKRVVQYEKLYDPKTCEECGVVYTPTGSVQRTCSRACALKRIHREEPRVTVECRWCGQGFETPARSAGRAKWCSSACSTRGKRAARKETA